MIPWARRDILLRSRPAGEMSVQRPAIWSPPGKTGRGYGRNTMPPARRRVLPALLVVFLGVAFCLADAMARDTEKSWEFGAYAVSSKYAGGTDIDPGTGWGARGGYHFKAIHEVEGSFDQVSANNSEVSSITYDVTKFSVDYLHVFLVKGHEKMIPFATFGLGMIGIDNGTDSLTSSAIRFGGGFKYFIKPRGGFRLDLKGYRWHGDSTVVNGDGYFSFDITLAATFLVGGGK